MSTPTPTTGIVPTPPPLGSGDQPRAKAPRRLGDRVFSGLSTGAGITILVTLAAVALFLVSQSLPVIGASAGHDGQAGQSADPLFPVALIFNHQKRPQQPGAAEAEKIALPGRGGVNGQAPRRMPLFDPQGIGVAPAHPGGRIPDEARTYLRVPQVHGGPHLAYFPGQQGQGAGHDAGGLQVMTRHNQSSSTHLYF